MNYFTRHGLKLQFLNPTRSRVTLKLSLAPDGQVSNTNLITQHLRKAWSEIRKAGISLSLMALRLKTSHRHQTLGEIILNPTRWVMGDLFFGFSEVVCQVFLIKSKACFLFSLSSGYHHISALKCFIWNFHNINRQLQTALSNFRLQRKHKKYKMQHHYCYLNSYIPKCPIEISHSFQKVNSLNASICFWGPTETLESSGNHAKP